MVLTIINETFTVLEGEAVVICVEVQTQGDILSSFEASVFGINIITVVDVYYIIVFIVR